MQYEGERGLQKSQTLRWASPLNGSYSMLNNMPFSRAPLCRKLRALTLFTMLQVLRLYKTAVALLLALVSLLATSGCQRTEGEEQRAALDDHKRRLRACVDSLRGQTRVPILGGGYLRVDRFAFSVPAIKLEDGECGTDGFSTNFYWTGQKVIPNDERFTGLQLTEVPKHWRLMKVATLLGNIKRCQQSPDLCKGPATPTVPLNWPPDLVVRMENYPLDVRLSREPAHPAIRTMSFVLRDWPRSDGAPRFVDCDIGRPVDSVSRDEWRTMAFGEMNHPCWVDLGSFDFRRGAARISTSTESLQDITSALKALQTYLSDSIEDQ